MDYNMIKAILSHYVLAWFAPKDGGSVKRTGLTWNEKIRVDLYLDEKRAEVIGRGSRDDLWRIRAIDGWKSLAVQEGKIECREDIVAL